MKKKSIAIIGAGPGGLAAAMLLGSKGYDVTIYEKHGYVGGRTSEIKLGDYKFDMGPTFLNRLYIAEEIFELTGRDIRDYIELYDLNPMYELVFHDKKIKMTRNVGEMVRQIDEVFPGNEGGYERYIEETRRKLTKLAPKFREMILNMLNGKLGVEDITQFIEEEKMITPTDWENSVGVYKGATFNLGHQLTQMLAFRPRNKFEELDKCWLVGGGTHPGSGLPIILESARITANGILQQDGITMHEVKPLPDEKRYKLEKNSLGKVISI